MVGGTVYRPFLTIPTLSAGDSAITVGTEAYAEWRKLPATGTLTVSGAAAWKVYDSGMEGL